MRRVSGTCTLHLVMGRISVTASMSCSEPMSHERLRPGAADARSSGARALRVRDRGHHVGDAWPRRHRAHAGPPGDARLPVGGMPGGLLVAHVDDANAFVEAAVVDRLDVAAAEGEEVRHAVPCSACATSRPP